jgi:exonuclease III
MASNNIGPIFSFNCNGLSDRIKRPKIFRWLKKNFKGITMLQETHSTIKAEKRWSRQLGFQNTMYFSHGKSNSNGVLTYIPNSLKSTVIDDLRDDEGRILILILELNKIKYSLVNIYAPTQNNQKEQIKFYNKLSTFLDKIRDTKIIMGGDYNTVLDPKLDRYRSKADRPTKVGYQLLSIMKEFHLKDIWRSKNPDTMKYTWKRTNPILQQSRIDMFLISESLEFNVNYVDIELSFMSDHTLIALSIIHTLETKRGPGYWKLNNDLVKNSEYCTMIESILDNQDTVSKSEDSVSDSVKWDVLKMILRRETITFSKKRATERKKNEEALTNELKDLEKTLADPNAFTYDLLEQYITVKSEWEALERYKMQGAIIRSKTKWYEEGEKNSKYFFDLEKYKHETKNIKKLKDNDNNILNSPDKILEHIQCFYKKLYSPDTNVSDNQEQFMTFSNSSKVSQADKLSLETPITEKEIWEAIQDLPSGKTPGTDGLSADFYKKFWPKLKIHFVNMVNDVYKNRELTSDQKRGIISLIPKPDKDLTQVKNWRPISILNTDYKILTKIFANRLKPILPELINTDQTGFVLGRLIGENIRVVDDLMNYCKGNNVDGLLVLLDFEKAFDSLSWNFLEYALKSYGFEDFFISWVKIFYTDINSSVTNNGFISTHFNLERGIRQGCPLSAYLFILCVELLAQKIREDENIKGIEIETVCYKIVQFADDTALIIKDQMSLLRAMDIINDFYKVSGLKLNVDKTTLVNMNIDEEIPIHPLLQALGLKWCNEAFRYLGIWFHRDINIMEFKNFRHRLEKMNNILKIWLRRDLSLKGKVTILKSLALSQLIYPTSMLILPQWVIKEANTIFYKFLWNHKPERISRSTMQKPINEGGLKMLNIEQMDKIIKINWIKIMLNNIGSKWAHIPIRCFRNIGFADFCKANFSEDYIPEEVPKFYKNCLTYLTLLKKSDMFEGIDVYNEFIWFNKHITSKNRPYFNKAWYDKGIKYIHQLLDKDLELLLQKDLEDKYCLGKVNFLEYLGLRSAIPMAWKTILRQSKCNPIYCIDDEELYVSTSQGLTPLRRCNNRILYAEILKEINPNPPNAFYFWRDLTGLDEYELKNIYYIPFTYIRECKVQSLQFKIIHNTYACGLKLKHWRRKPTDACSYCNMTDNLAHHFCDCDQMVIFWNSLIRWWSTKCNDCTIHDNCDILLGIWDNRCHRIQLNFIILVAKWVISRCKIQGEPVDFLTFLPELYTKIRLERNVLIKQNKLDEYIDLWGLFIEY